MGAGTAAARGRCGTAVAFDEIKYMPRMGGTERKSSSRRPNGKSTSAPLASRCFDFQPRCRCSIYRCPHRSFSKYYNYFIRQRLWLRLGVNVDDQLWLRLNPIPIRNCNPSANPSPSRNTNTNPNANRPTTPLLTLTDPLTSK